MSSTNNNSFEEGDEEVNTTTTTMMSNSTSSIEAVAAQRRGTTTTTATEVSVAAGRDVITRPGRAGQQRDASVEPREEECCASSQPPPSSSSSSLADDEVSTASLPDILINSYDVLGMLGEGTYGRVYRCRHKGSGRYEAIKLLRYDENCERIALARSTLRERRRSGNIIFHGRWRWWRLWLAKLWSSDGHR